MFFFAFVYFFYEVHAQSVEVGNVEEFVVNLDVPPEQRWAHIITMPRYKQELLKTLEVVENMLPTLEREVVDFVFNVISPQIEHFLGDYGREIQGSADILNIDVGYALLINLVYEIIAHCTSIVAETDNGIILHARNMDFAGIWQDDSEFQQHLKNLTVQLDFRRGGKTVYRGTTFVGYGGLATGMKPGAFSVTINERDEGTLWENLLEALLVPNVAPVSFLVRDVLDSAKSYDDALSIFATHRIVAPAFLILAGMERGQGAVITRDRNYAVDIWTLDSPKRWFEVETNYDHWKPPPPNDDRSTPAIKAMNRIGQRNITLSAMFDVLSIPPVLNSETTYTSLLCPRSNTLITYVRW
jgi:hypothetical protein